MRNAFAESHKHTHTLIISLLFSFALDKRFSVARIQVAEIVAQNKESGFWNPSLQGHGYQTFKQQGLKCGVVAIMEACKHDPTITHDNFVRILLGTFLAKPHRAFKMDELWSVDPFYKSFISTIVAKPEEGAASQILHFHCPPPACPQSLTVRQAEADFLVKQAARGLGALKKALADPEKLKAALLAQRTREDEAQCAAAATLVAAKAAMAATAAPALAEPAMG